jgi:hypothetical protein
MRTLCVITLALAAGAIELQAQNSKLIDVENLFPNVAGGVTLVDPNDAGIPAGVIGGGTGVLIHEQVLLVNAHGTRLSESGVPPFIHGFVTFNLHVFDDRSTWIPIAARAWHPKTLPCPNHQCNWPDPPLANFTDVGLVLLQRPVKGIKPANLAPPGTLDKNRGQQGDQILVGYGFLDSAPGGGPLPWSQWPGVRHYLIIPPVQPFDDFWAYGQPGEVCFGDSGGPIFLDPPADSGRKSREVVALTSAFEGNVCSTGRSIPVRIDNEDVQNWINQQINEWLGVKH